MAPKAAEAASLEVGVMLLETIGHLKTLFCVE